MTPISEFVMYIFHNVIEQTKHGDMEKIKVIRCKSYIPKGKKKNEDSPGTRGSRFIDQCVKN